eukprot:301496-Pyramimonas_sp.AAC.1
MSRPPWPRDPNAAGCEVKTRAPTSIAKPPNGDDRVDARPDAARGLAAERAYHLAMGPALGCRDCQAVHGGD